MARTDPRPHYGLGRRVRDDGYVDIWEPSHPLARRDGYVFEHRKVMWDAGFLIDSSLEVHHKNEIKTDNRLENLEIKTGSDHTRGHVESLGFVTNQYGTFPVKPRESRQSAPRPEGRTCEWCSGPIDPSARRDARFCSSRCQITSWKSARRDART